MKTDTPFDFTQEHADAINALLPTCKYVVGIGNNKTGEIRFSPIKIDWDENSLRVWFYENMSCDCNLHVLFETCSKGFCGEKIRCGNTRYTVIGIWFPDSDEIRDMNDLISGIVSPCRI